MYTLDPKKPVPVHFIGIGGISMSGLARILVKEGFPVSGSDREESELTRELEAAGIRVAHPQSADNIRRFSEPEPIGLVVYTAAIHPDNPEYAAAAAAGIPMMTRAELLGEIMSHYRDSVAVAGTHGKTTTTAMISRILVDAGTDPTVSVGAIVPEIGGNLRIGDGNSFVAEACEYTNSFLSLCPRYAVILDIEADHLDFFKDLNDIRSSFARFAGLVPEDGAIVIGDNVEKSEEITGACACKRVVTFGLSEKADVRASEISYSGAGSSFLMSFSDGAEPVRVSLSVPGEHNILDALAAAAVAKLMGIDARLTAGSLAHFGGAARRFEILGEWRGATIVDDYAHHPTEIAATLSAARGMGYSRIWCIFQPHTYTRTKAFLDGFADALQAADLVVLADIYAARETDTLGISSADIMAKIRKNGHSCEYFPSFSAIKSHLLKNCREGDLLIFMGAGEVDKIGYSMLEEE